MFLNENREVVLLMWYDFQHSFSDNRGFTEVKTSLVREWLLSVLISR